MAITAPAHPASRTGASTISSRRTATSTSLPTCGPPACPPVSATAPSDGALEQGDAWIFDGGPGPMPFGLNACAGMDFAMRRAMGPLRGPPPRRLATRRPAWPRSTATRSTPRCFIRPPGCPRRSPLNPDPDLPPGDGPGLQRLALGVRRATTRPAFAPCLLPAQPGSGAGPGRGRTRSPTGPARRLL